jgi:hypothetical protein
MAAVEVFESDCSSESDRRVGFRVPPRGMRLLLTASGESAIAPSLH